MILLNINEVFTKENAKTHIRFPFRVPENEGFSALKISFKYSPKRGSDMRDMLNQAVQAFQKYAPYTPDVYAEAAKHMPLTNHITISLDSPVCWLGTKHSPGYDNNYMIGAQSSPGFLDTEILPGGWTVTLSFNSVITETVECSVLITGR